MFNAFIGSKYNYHGLGNEMSSAIFVAPSVELQRQTHLDANEIQVSGVKVRKEQDSIHKNNVYFRDPLNYSYVNIGMSNENLSKLKNLFGANSVKSENNQFLLNDEAEKFVSSWYADIAYKRGYIRADENQDGFLTTEERKNTHSFTLGYMYGNPYGKTKDVYLLAPNQTYVQLTSINPQYDNMRINKYTSSSIEEELNRMIELDKNASGSIIKNQVWETNEFVKALDDIMDNSPVLELPTIEEFLKPIEQMDKDNKEMLKEELKKAGIDSNTIDLNASAEEVFKQIMEKDNGAEVLQNIKEKLENQGKNSEDSTFKEIAKLTKLDEETLAYNLNNNPNFEEDIISIVQELTQNVDSQFALNDDSNALQKAFSITA